MQHLPMHIYTGEELRSLLPGCTVLELAGSNVTTEGSAALFEQCRWMPEPGRRL